MLEFICVGGLAVGQSLSRREKPRLLIDFIRVIDRIYTWRGLYGYRAVGAMDYTTPRNVFVPGVNLFYFSPLIFCAIIFNARESAATTERPLTDISNAVRDCYTRESASSEFAVESVFGKVFDALGEEYTSKIKYIYVPLGYTYIFSYAFADLCYLNKITFPKTVTGIENYALAGCKNLTELTLPYDSYADIIGIFGAKKDTLMGYKLTTFNVYRPNGKSTVEFLSENCILFENLTTVNIHTEFIGGITYMVDGRKINDSKTVFKNGVDETSGTITYYLK